MQLFLLCVSNPFFIFPFLQWLLCHFTSPSLTKVLLKVFSIAVSNFFPHVLSLSLSSEVFALFSIKTCHYQGTIGHHIAKTNSQFSVLNLLDPSAAFSTAAHALFKNTSLSFRTSRKMHLLGFLLAHWSLFLCLYADSSSSVWLLDIEVMYTQSFELFSLCFLNEFIQFCALNTLSMLMTSKAVFSVSNSP